MKPLIIGISGASGSGKTRFVEQFKLQFPQDSISVFSLDNYYKPKEFQQKDTQGIYNFDLPESIDFDSFLSDFQSVLNHKSITIKEYTFNNPNKNSQKIQISPSPILLLEGIFIFHQSLASIDFDKKIFIEADLEIALERRLIRDLQERSYMPEEVKYQWYNHFIPSYHAHILPRRGQCDLILESDENFDACIKQFCVDLKQEINWSV